MAKSLLRIGDQSLLKETYLGALHFLTITPSPWLKKGSKRLQIEEILPISDNYSFTMVEEIFVEMKYYRQHTDTQLRLYSFAGQN